MKKTVLFLVINTFFFSSIFAQIFPTHDDNPEWTVFYVEWEELGEKIYTTGEDTIINEQIVTPVFVERDGNTTGVGYYSVEGEKVFFFHPDAGGYTKRLLYDFSLEMGDSTYIGLLPFSDDSMLVEVIDVDTVYYGAIPRKKIRVRSLNDFFTFVQTWIEGIGCLRHPFYPTDPVYNASLDYYYQLLCLVTDAGTLYGGGSNCPYTYPDRTRWYVNSHATFGHIRDGSSWENAFIDLQDAIEQAGEGDSIWVASGTYYATDDNYREASFVLNQGVAIYGGFDGTETGFEQRDFESNETILSGDIGVLGDSLDNSYHIVYSIGTDSTSVLDGFTLTKGNARPENNVDYGKPNFGGGLLIDTDDEHVITTPTINNCRFINNSGQYGSAIACLGANGRYAVPIVKNSYFYKNRAMRYGGAFYNTGDSYPDSPQKIINCNFEENWSWYGGGGVCLRDVKNDFLFKNCTFLKNTGYAGSGAIYILTYRDQGTVTLDSCRFNENDGGANGGLSFVPSVYYNSPKRFGFDIKDCSFYKNVSLHDSGGALSFYSLTSITDISLIRSSFIENTALSGGAIRIFTEDHCTANLKVDDCIFKGNVSPFPAGGAIYIRGTYADDTIRNYATISNTLFYKNTGALGVGNGQGTSEMTVKNCTFYDNGSYPIVKVWDDNDNGYYSLMDLSNCIIWEPNTPLYNVFYNGTPTTQNLYDYTIENCIIAQHHCNLPGCDEAMINVLFGENPMFIDVAGDDFRVAACSPAINAGNNAGLDSLEITTDLDGNERILEEIVDIGAYERNYIDGTVTVGDVSCFGGNDGTFSYETNGEQPVEAIWSNGIFSDTTTVNLESGDYYVYFTDASGCQDIDTVVINEPDQLLPEYAITHVSAIGSNDGSLILENISGGTPPYSFHWNNGDTTSSIENLVPGWYTLEITDANDCYYEFSYQISVIDATDEIIVEDLPKLIPNLVHRGTNPILFLPQGGIAEIGLYDMTGKLISSKKVEIFQKEIEINTAQLEKGVYLLMIKELGGNRSPIRFVVQ